MLSIFDYKNIRKILGNINNDNINCAIKKGRNYEGSHNRRFRKHTSTKSTNTFPY